jgi:Glycosyl hydrolase family 26
VLTRRELVVRGASAAVLASPLVQWLARSDAALAAPVRRWSFGAYVNPANVQLTFDAAQKAFAARESLLGARLRIASTFVAWEEPFPNEGHELDRSAGRAPLIAWDGLRDLRAIAAGRWDSLLRERARACAAFGAPIYLRWGAEFNGEWNPCYGRASDFVAAWRHMVSVFRSSGARNVRWVWCPFTVQRPRRGGPEDWRPYYPGHRFVDWVGMDGYNWGTTRAWSRWQSFSEIFGALYADYAGRRPLMICEVASAERGGDKAAWIADMSAKLAGRFSKVRTVVWFDTDKETDWRVDSSPSALRAFRSIL